MTEINVKEAVKAAKDALLELYEDDPPKGMALEEIEKVQDNGRELWAVTLGFLRHTVVAMPMLNNIGALFNPAPSQIEQCVYKTVFIDAASGQFVKMDIRQVS